MPYEIRFLISLAITVAAETTVIFIVIRGFWKTGAAAITNQRCLFAGIFASCATMPYLWFILPAIVKPYIVLVVAGEIGAVVVEAVFFNYVLNVPAKRAGVLSLAANAASIVVGLAVFR